MGRISTNKGKQSWDSIDYSGTLKKSYVVHSQGRTSNLLSVKGMAIIAVEKPEGLLSLRIWNEDELFLPQIEIVRRHLILRAFQKLGEIY